MKKLLPLAFILALSPNAFAETLSSVMPGLWQVDHLVTMININGESEQTQLKMGAKRIATLPDFSTIVECSDPSLQNTAAILGQEARSKNVKLRIDTDLFLDLRTPEKLISTGIAKYSVQNFPTSMSCKYTEIQAIRIDDAANEVTLKDGEGNLSKSKIEIKSHDEIEITDEDKPR